VLYCLLLTCPLIKNATRLIGPTRRRWRWQMGLAVGITATAIAPLIALPAAAQSIRPANDGTGTVVRQRGDRYDIGGGSRSRDGANLFHSLERFGLNRNEIANFLADPQVRNILSRVVGGDASVIDGLIRVSGSDANLFLLNPAGVIFGSNARLDVPASFTATSATGIGLEGGWFNAAGDADYGALVGTPNRFAFSLDQPGAVLNAGELRVQSGQSLSLLGGVVVNTGTLVAPGGQILIAAVPGESLVRLSQEGQILGLEIEAIAPNHTNANGVTDWTLPIASLPELLTGGNLSHSTRLEVRRDGTIALAGSGIELPDRPEVVAIAGEVDASATSSNQAGGTVAIAGREIGLLEANIDVSGTDGGTVQVGGAYQGRGSFPRSDRTFISRETSIQADARETGNGGRVYVWSDLETGFYGDITARGGTDRGDGGFVEVSGRQHLDFRGTVDVGAVNGEAGTLLIDPVDIVILPGEGDSNGDGTDTFAGSPSGNPGEVAAADVTPTEIFESELEGITGNIVLEATNDITIEALSDGELTLQPGESAIFRADADNNGVGSFTMNEGDAILTSGRDLTIAGATVVTGDINTLGAGSLEGFFIQDSGSITVAATTGNVQTGTLTTGSFPFEVSESAPVSVGIPGGEAEPRTGSVTVTSDQGNIQVDAINTSLPEFVIADVQGGDVAIEGAEVEVDGDILTGGGNVAVTGTSVVTGDINTLQFVRNTFYSYSGEFDGGGTYSYFNLYDSGDITIAASTGDIQAGRLTTADLPPEAATADGIFFFDSGSGEGGLGTFSTGSITVTSEQGDVVVEQLGTNLAEASSASLSALGVEAGDVTVAGDLVRITDTDADGNAISTAGFVAISGGELVGSLDGTVSIQHAGGPDNVDFEVGNAAINGSAGSISTGSTVLTTGEFPVEPEGGLAAGTPAGIAIASVNTPPALTGSASAATTSNEPVSISLASIFATDANNDNTALAIASIAAGATLTRDGVVLAVGDEVLATDTLVYTPPPDELGPLEAFTVQANDVVSVSDPIAVVVEASAPEPPPEPPEPPPEPPEPPPGPPEPPEPPPGPPEPPGPPPPPVQPDPGPDSEPDLDEQDRDRLSIDLEARVSEPGFVPPSEPILNSSVGNDPLTLATRLSSLEQEFLQDFTGHLGLSAAPELVTPDEAQEIARLIEEATGEKPAFIYVSFIPAALSVLPGDYIPQDSDQLELVVITARGGLMRRRVPEATRGEVMAAAEAFRREVTSPIRSDRYLPLAQQLYDWIVAPLQDELVAREVTNLSFLADVGLRSLPYAALHDGETFLVEQYSVGLMPSLSLTDTRYVDVRDVDMLAMGVSESTQGQEPLPAVPVELSTLIFDLWRGQLYLNESATVETLRQVRDRQPFGIIHMATHADFIAGPISDSYIQLWEERLQFDQVRQLGFNDPPVEMLVLSACRTALGDEQAELGFAGLAVQTGVKTAVASLWYVSDTATTALMTEFYNSLTTAPIKAEALRRAQRAMIRGEVFLEDGQLFVPGLPGGIPLPEESLGLSSDVLAHPYFWSGFTVIGNPW